MEGYQYTHTISYIIMPDLYLKGVGYGSSYVVEVISRLRIYRIDNRRHFNRLLDSNIFKMMGSKSFIFF